MPSRLLQNEIIGKKYNKLTCVKYSRQAVTPNGSTRSMFLFKCECGKIKELCGSMVKRGKTLSCGCINIEQITKLAKRVGKDKASYSHGFFGTRFYRIYGGIVARTRHRLRFYENIKNGWSCFEDFRDDMYQSYLEHVSLFGEKNTTIDRIDSSGNYSKENCRWSTYKEQQNNRKDNTKVKIEGKILNLGQWATILKTSSTMLTKRIKRGELGEFV